MLIAEIGRALAPHGLITRGGFAPGAADGAPEGVRALVLIGNVGPALWEAFAPHAGEAPDALDRWTERVVAPLAARFGARPLYPFGGPPYWPFQRWAMRAEPVRPSPLGILIHPEHGLWHAYRAALVFDRPVPLPARVVAPCPCDSCEAKPCLSACPVGAFTPGRYDVAACVKHIGGSRGAACRAHGCAARAACPVGTPYGPDQVRFHMDAFLRANRRAPAARC